MWADRHLILVDGDLRRRAMISHCLSSSGIHVEPFEHDGELISRWPRAGLVLVHDSGGGIVALARHMSESGNWLPMIAYAEQPSPEMIVAAVLDGAINYIGWPFGAEQLEAALAAAEARAAKLGSAKLREALARSRVERLTRREREVLSGVANGLSNRLIGQRLSISPRTVEIHRSNMLNKMGAHHTSEAIRIAIEAALVS
jgi:two-component system, LuxR family, response regulator FixJ